MATVLIVDDDNDIRSLLEAYLQDHSLRALTARDGPEMKRVLSAERVEVVLLDIMLPGEDGLSLCRWLRQENDTAIIMITALAEEGDRVLGLELGADDYLTKPFSSRELLARIRAVLRRAPQQASVHQPDKHQRYRFNGWVLDTARRSLKNPLGVHISLSAGAYDLLLAFVRKPGQVLSRDHLLAATKGRKADPFDRSVDVQLSRLRRQLGDMELIKTVRGGGYLFCADVVTSEAE